MGHKRVKMELIKNERNRIQTFKKRKANLMKKMSEFSILCGVEACLITFGPTRTTEAAKEEEDDELETWPSDPRAVRAMIQRYRTSDGPKRTYQLSDYFAEKKKRVDLELAKINRQIYRRRFAAGWDSRLDGFSADQLTVLLGQLDTKLKLADKKLASFSSAEAARRCNRLEFDFNPMVIQFPPVAPAAAVRNSDIMTFGGDIEKFGLCNDYLEVRQQQQGNSSQSTLQQEQQQSSFMALLNANSSEASNEIQYPNLHSHIGLQQLLPDVNSSDGCYSAAAAAAAEEEEELSPNELSNTWYSIDFELFNHQVTKPVPDSQMMMMTRFGGYGQDSETYGSFGAAAATYPNPWGLDSYGEFGMINYSHDWSTMSYMNPPLSSFQQILQQPRQLPFPTTAAAGFAAAHYHHGQFSQQVDGDGGHHAPMTGSSGFNQK